MITLNGKTIDDADGLTLVTFLLREKYALSRIAVECNGKIVPKVQYDRKQLADGDILEIVCFVGGG